MKKMKRRLLSGFLALLLFLQCFMLDLSSIKASASTESELSNWNIRVDFLDPETNTLTDNYTITQETVTYGTKEVIMQVSIEYTGDGSVTYASEDVSFFLVDLRDILIVDISDHYSYDVAAELKGSDTGRGDWYYEVDAASKYSVGENEFTFTNKEAITGAFTSTFQILMEFYPLCSAANFTKDFSTSLSFNNIEGSVLSNTATFTYQGKKSTYELIPSYIELEDGLSDEILGKIPDGKDSDDYIFADVQIMAPYVEENISNVYKTILEAAFPEDVLIGNHTYIKAGYRGIFERSTFSVDDTNTLTISSAANDYYLSAEDEGDVCLNFYVAFPREKYTNLGTYDITFHLTGLYLGEEDYVTLDSTTLTFNFSEFNYYWEPGDLYVHLKEAYNTTNPDSYRSNYDNNYVYENMVYAYDKHESALSEGFYVSVTAVYTGETYDMVIGDDLSYFVYEDNTYRKVEDDERFLTYVTIPAVGTVSGIEVYGRLAGSDTYELYTSYSSLSSNKTIKIKDKEYCDMMIKYYGLTDTIQDKSVYFSYAYVTNTARDNGKKPAKVYNFSYADFIIDNTAVSIDREAVTTNITGLDAEIDAFDLATYGSLKFRATDYKTVLSNKAGIEQSRGSGSTYDDKKTITDDMITVSYCTSPLFYDYQCGGNTWCDFTDTYNIPAHWEVENFSYIFDDSVFLFEDGTTITLDGIIPLDDLPDIIRSQITFTKELASDGSTNITVHFDFTDNKLINDEFDFYFFKPYFELTIDRDTFEMFDMNGTCIYVPVTRSINQDSNDLVFEYTNRSWTEFLYCPSIAYATYQGILAESSVDGELFNDSDKNVEVGDTYEYKLMLHTGDAKAKYVTFFDTLDGAYGTNSYWKGSLLKVDTSDLESLGATPVIYYSTNETQSHDLSASGWTLSTAYTGNLSDVKAIAVDLGEYVIDANSLALIRIKMQVPNDLASVSKSAYNNGSVSYKSYDASLSNLTTDNASETISGLTSNTTILSIKSSANWAYIDGINGSDANNGLTPSTPVKTFKQAYTNIKDNGGTIYVVDTVSVTDEMTLSSTYYQDQDTTIAITDDSFVSIRRYAKPTVVNDGFDVDSHVGVLIQVEDGGTLTLTDITVDGHKNALEEGNENQIAVGVEAQNAMLNILEGGIAYLTDATLANNKNTASVSGGAVSNAGTFIVTDGVITDNYADYHGAGIYNTGSVLLKSSSNSSSTKICNNETDYSGGGIYTSGSLEFDGQVLIDSNKGSGIFTYHDLVLPSGVEISNNEEVHGSGVYVKTGAHLTIDGALIHDNYPAYRWGDGSGVFAEHQSMVTLNSGKIYNNGKASDFCASNGGGICLDGDNYGDETYFIMNGGEIYGNEATYGGGVSLVGHVVMTANSGKIYQNTGELGGGVYLGQYGQLSEATFCGDSSVYNNEATEAGGGIYNYMCIVNVKENSLVTNNSTSASGVGGGICNEEGTLTITGGTVSLNEALDGGGIYNAGGTFTMSDGTIKQNTASGDGGGIYNTDLIYSWGTYYGVTTLTGGTITNNTSTNNGQGFYQNGALYMNTNGKVAINNDVYLPTDRIIIVNGELSYTDIGAVITPSDYTLGRCVVRCEYENDSDENAMASEVYALFTLTPKDTYCLRPGDYIHETASILDTDVVISCGYSITYKENLDSEAVSNMPADQVKYWNEETTLSEDIPTCATYKFVGWDKNATLDLDTNTPAYSTGSKISYDINEDLVVYAQWIIKAYDIFYELDGGKNHPNNPDSYTYGEGVEEFYDPTKQGHEFIGWYEDENFTIPITSIDADRTGDVTLYPKWSKLIQVFYNGNGSDSGTIKSEIVSELTASNEYIIRANTGYTDYKKTGATFSGWDISQSVLATNTVFKEDSLPQTITFDALEDLIDENTTVTVNGVEDVAVVTLYAIWDDSPSISITPANDPDNKEGEGTTDPNKGSILTFYEGETVTKEMLLENVMANDKEDGSLNDAIRIIKISYAEGKVIGDEKLAAYEETWSDDMPEDATLDTWFMQLDKEDSPITHTITYAVTDSAGNETTLDWNVKVSYNEAPIITAADRYFTLEEARAGIITKESLLAEITASDTEDDLLYGEGCLNDNVEILSFDANEFIAFEGSGYVVLTLRVHDSMGPEATCSCTVNETSHPVGKETLKQIVIYIVDGNEKVNGPNVRYVRFIDSYYYGLNKDKYLENLSEEEKETLNHNGGLMVASKWYTQESYKNLLETSFSATTEADSFMFDNTAVDAILSTIDNSNNLATPDGFYNTIVPYRN